jgi:bacillithiol biosynthesis deacetylase BshB1
MRLDLLAIAPHPDDVELTSGGTMLKMARAGYCTGILDLTRGETGTRGTPETRLKEAARAAEILGVKIRRNLGLPDAHLENSDAHKTAVAEVIREFDHYTAGRMCYEACFVAGLKNYALDGLPFRPFKVIYAAAYADVRPTFAVDITAEYEQRRKAILAYASQFRPPKKDRTSRVTLPLDELEDRMNSIARHYGRMIGVKYAEGFVVKEVMQVDDLVRMPVRSI